MHRKFFQYPCIKCWICCFSSSESPFLRVRRTVKVNQLEINIIYEMTNVKMFLNFVNEEFKIKHN